MHTHTHSHTHTHTHIHIRTPIQTQTHTHTHTDGHMYVFKFKWCYSNKIYLCFVWRHDESVTVDCDDCDDEGREEDRHGQQRAFQLGKSTDI